MKLHCFAIAVVVSLSVRAWGFPLEDRFDSRLDPGVLKAIETGVLATGTPLSWCGRAAFVHPGSAPVVVELDSTAREALLDELELAGLVISRAHDKRLFYRRFVPGLVDKRGIARLLRLPEVVKISPSVPLGPLPLDLSARLIDRDQGWGARPASDLLTGAGVTIGDIDSNVDVFHPHFFNGDGGYFDWIDINENGIFETAIDAVDLNRDGIADDAEVAELLRAEMLEAFSGSHFPARDSEFDPAVDWVFLDNNGNGTRDFGADNGFDDSAPAFGEPLFVPDDIDLSGTLDPGERLIRLGSSKFKKVYVDTTYYPLVEAISRVYERGVDLAEHRTDFVGAAYGYSEALHATGVLSILAGDLPLAGRRFVGVLPEADLLLGFEIGGLPAATLAWVLGESPDVVLHELAPWTGEVLDGSDAYSAMVDESTAKDNVSHSCPVGNTGGSRKHTRSQVDGTEKIMDFTIPSLPDLSYVNLSLNIIGDVAKSIRVKGPEGTEIDLLSNDKQLEITPQIYAFLSEKVSPKGTHFFDLIMYTAGTNMDDILGNWSLVVAAAPGSLFTVDAYLMDNVSGWSEGVAWAEEIASDDHTIGIPAVSESCIAIGAYTAHWDESGDEPWYYIPGEQGHVRHYSGRGPTIDGRPKPDVVAPDNPWAAAPHGASMGEDLPHGALSPFGGTSGAGPHVAGVAGMLAQAGVHGASARQAIQQGATNDEITGEGHNSDYGWGRLSAAGALAVARGGQKPVVNLKAESTLVEVPGEVVLTASATDQDSGDDQLEIKWDDAYDGSWDIGYGTAWERTVSFTEEGVYPFKVRVRDEGGLFAESVVWVKALKADMPTDTDSDAGTQDTDAPTDGGTTYVSVSGGGGCDCRFFGRHQKHGFSLAFLLGMFL